MPTNKSLITQSIGKQWLDVNYAGNVQAYHNLDIYLPILKKRSYKAIIVIYGSAWRHNNRKQHGFETLGQPLLNAGFAVVSINHRSSADALWPAQLHDVKAAIRFIRANADKYCIDASFIGITGFSSGGHLASLAALTHKLTTYTFGNITVDLEGSVGKFGNTSSEIHAVTDWFGPTDFTRFKNCSTFNDANSPEADLIGGNPADHLDALRLLSPLTYIKEDAPRFLIIHGNADVVVPYCQSLYFAEKLEANNLLDEFIIVPGGQHGLLTFNEFALKKMADFFVKSANDVK